MNFRNWIVIDLILKVRIKFIFLTFQGELPSKTEVKDSKVIFEFFTQSFIWEDEGIWELRNHHFREAFKYVIAHRMTLITGSQSGPDYLRSKSFDESIFRMAMRHFPDWIGFDKSRCSFNSEFANRSKRIKKVQEWRLSKM